MSAYRQILRVGDYQGDVVWEMVISAEYSKCFAGAEPVQDVDIFNIESIKYEGETLTLQQKDDEFQFSMQEYNATTQADSDAIALMKSAEYSDVWVAIFEHEPIGATAELVGSMSFERMVFSGLVRRKASAEDLLWHGEQWENNPNPLRSWKFSAQAFGSAVMDTVNLASKKVDDTVIAGVLDQLELVQGVDITDLQIEDKIYNNESTYKSAMNFDRAIRAILQKTQDRKQEKLPGFEIELLPSEIGYSYANQLTNDNSSNAVRKIRLFDEPDPAIYFGGLWVDSRLIKPKMNDDGITPDSDHSLSWHRFDSVTDLLYNLSVCFGTQLRVRNVGGSKIQIKFDPITEGTGKRIELIDAVKADLDIQSVSASSSDKFSCQATAVCNEGYSTCLKNGDYVQSTDKVSGGSAALPLSVSTTYQFAMASSGASINLAWLNQNCDSDAGVTHKMTWTGMLAMFANNANMRYSTIRGVATTINGKAYWYEKLSDLLNAKISANGEYYRAEYKLELPYIKSFRRAEETTPNPSEGGESGASLKNLELFDKIILDGKEYIITSIEIKPTDGTVSIKMSRSSRYGFAEPSEPIFGKITVPAHGDIYDNYKPAVSETAGERIENNSLVRRGVDGKIYNYLNTEANYGSYLGVAVISADEGDAVMYRTAGESYSANELVVAKPVYARTTTPNPSEGGELRSRAVASSLRLNERTIAEQSDIRIGFAKTANTWQMQLGNEFIIE